MDDVEQDQLTRREGSLRIDRRTLLGAIAGAGTASLAGCTLFDRGADAPTADVTGNRARELAERFAPTIYFDADERWFPTDPRPYESEQDGDPVVDGFTAFNDYTRRFRETGAPPDPAVFYHVVEYEASPLAVVQYWLYSAFDQFTTNFHWHDWEALHVFVDTDTGDPALHVASSHSRKIPNNEFLDPDPDRSPHILSELGSHSSALSVNEDRDAFHRLPDGDLLADITNSTLESLESLAQIPIAYGLPRGEGFRLPFVLPELDDAPIYEHPDLPDVTVDDLLPDRLTVHSFDDLRSPPTDLPRRSTGTVFVPSERDADSSQTVTYDLVPTSEVEHIMAFTGPQLGFEFAVPQFAEDAFAGHLTTTGVPWGQPRYQNPAADISDPTHRRTLAERYDVIGDASPVNSVITSIRDVVSDPDAPENSGVTTTDSTVEAIALLESDPEAVPTFNGIVAVQDVPAGDHRLTINRAGTAPHSETVSIPDDAEPTPVVAGVDGNVPLVAREHATKLEVDTDGTDADLERLAVEDDFGGRLYDAPLDGPDAVYVHRGGAYTTEVRDRDGEVGAHRVNPRADQARSRIDRPDTGKAPLATYVADVSDETRAQVAAVADETANDSDDGGRENSLQGLEKALAAVRDAARRAAERAEAGDKPNADKHLQTVADRLERVSNRIAEAEGDLPDDLRRAAQKRQAQSKRRNEQAKNATKLGERE